MKKFNEFWKWLKIGGFDVWLLVLGTIGGLLICIILIFVFRSELLTRIFGGVFQFLGLLALIS